MSNKKSIMAIAAAVAFGLPPAAVAATVLFDPTGNAGQNPNPVVEFDVFDWSPGNALAQGVVAGGTPQPGTRFTLYSHASLGTFNLGGTPLSNQGGLNQTFEMTFVLSTGLVVQSASPNFIQVGFSADDPSFFEVYVDSINPATRSHAATGSGYNDGTLVLQGTVDRQQPIGGAFFVFTPTTVNLDNFSGPITDPQGNAVTQPNSYPGVRSIQGTGATSLQVNTNFIDHRFFFGTSATDDLRFQLNLNFNTSQITPFREQDPSECFTGVAVANAQQDAQGVLQCNRTFNQGLVNGTGGAIVAAGGVNANVGSINGLSGPDFIFQVDANSSIARAIPAPATMTLFGLGLGFFGLSRRKPGRRA